MGGKLSTRFKHLLHRGAASFERDWDDIRWWLAGGRGHHRRVHILAYAGYRNAETLRLKGRVVDPRAFRSPGRTAWSRFRAMLSIYNSHELPGIEVRFEGHDASRDLVSDEEGYFEFELALDRPLPARTTWEKARLAAPGRQAQDDGIEVPVLAPGTDNHWGVISDIDDTVMETGATNFLKNWRRVLLHRPEDRLAVPGAADLYRMIAHDHERPVRPFFYVSSSPWNLYGFITRYMELNGIPHGPMFLKDIGIDRNKFIKTGHGEHKLAAIETILAFYPGFRFLLIGDSGQHDIPIYAQAVEDFPARVGAVFIRDVGGTCASGEKARLLAGIADRGIPTFCGEGFGDAIAVAEKLGLDRPLEAARAATLAEHS